MDVTGQGGGASGDSGSSGWCGDALLVWLRACVRTCRPAGFSTAASYQHHILPGDMCHPFFILFYMYITCLSWGRGPPTSPGYVSFCSCSLLAAAAGILSSLPAGIATRMLCPSQTSAARTCQSPRCIRRRISADRPLRACVAKGRHTGSAASLRPSPARRLRYVGELQQFA